MNELNELKTRLQAWLDSLNPRERRLVIGGGAFLAILLLYQLTWAPFVNGVATMQTKVEKRQQELLWMQQAAAEVKALRGGAGGHATHGGSLLGLIEKTARQRDLGSSIRKVQPEGQDGVRIWMDNVSFDAVMSWLDELQVKQGIMISSFSAEGTEQPGRVNVRILAEGQ